jgi:hypothetical protein
VETKQKTYEATAYKIHPQQVLFVEDQFGDAWVLIPSSAETVPFLEVDPENERVTGAF